MSISSLTNRPAPTQSSGFRIQHTAGGVVLTFPALRAPGAALSLLAFSLLCALLPALGLGALLPLENADAAAIVSLTLICGFAAPFILASVVFALLALDMLANSLRVDIDANGIRTERRVLGQITRRCDIARADIAEVEPRTSSRSQNIFSTTPRYTLIARHAHGRGKDVVVAEDLAGHALMLEVRGLICAPLSIP